VASAFTAMVHDQLTQIFGARACSSCLAAALKIERWDVLKGIRELILTGRVRAETDDCGVCRRRELVARLLPLYRTGARE
jgi:hypothetical protein